MRLRSVLATVAILATPIVAAAQAGRLVGTVARDSAGHMLGGITVTIPSIGRAAQTNYLGEFGLSNLVPGQYQFTVRALGYAPFTDTVTIVAGATMERDVILRTAVVQLDTVRSSAQANVYHSPALRGFEERRRSGQGGYFISDSLFRANESQKMPDVLGRIPGLTKVPIGANTYLASGRSTGNDGGPVFLSRQGANVWCFVSVYVDGVRRFVAPPNASNQPPDFNGFSVSEYAGAEYYPSSASIPPQYNATGSSCGVLLLWTRER